MGADRELVGFETVIIFTTKQCSSCCNIHLFKAKIAIIA